MTYPDFRRLLLAAGDTPDLTAYVSDEGGSVPAADLPLLPIIHQMGQGDLTIRSIAQACGLSVRRLGHELGISYPTASKWSYGSRSPSPWQLHLIAYAAISLDRGETDEIFAMPTDQYEEDPHMKLIYMRATSKRAREAGFTPSHDLAMIPVMVDLDKLTPAARWLADHITATYVTDEGIHSCLITAEAGFSMADRDRAKGVSEAMIARKTEAWEEVYTSRMTTPVTFSILSRQTPEEVIETAVTQLIDAGTVRLISPRTREEYRICADD